MYDCQEMLCATRRIVLQKLTRCAVLRISGLQGKPKMRIEESFAVQDVTPCRLSEEALAKTRLELAHVARIRSLGVLTARSICIYRPQNNLRFDRNPGDLRLESSQLTYILFA